MADTIRGVTRSNYGTLSYSTSMPKISVGICTMVAFEESNKNNVVPILSQDVLDDILFKLIEDDNQTAEFISYADKGQFFSYTFQEINEWPDAMHMLGCIGLVLNPHKPIKLIFPYLHGVKWNESKRGFQGQNCFGY